MARVENMVVIAVTWKGKQPGSKGWASVYDSESFIEARAWIKERKSSINHVAITHGGEFKTIKEIDLFKSMLKGMLNLEGGYSGNEEECDWFCDIEMEMKHFFENNIKKL